MLSSQMGSWQSWDQVLTSVFPSPKVITQNLIPIVSKNSFPVGKQRPEMLVAVIVEGISESDRLGKHTFFLHASRYRNSIDIVC